MVRNVTNRVSLMVLAAVVVVALFTVGRLQSATAQREAAASAAARYTVVETEGHNLIVTDNQSNTLYFYTIDKDKEIGSELKLRGSVDLNQVGKPAIMPQTVKAAP